MTTKKFFPPNAGKDAKHIPNRNTSCKEGDIYFDHMWTISWPKEQIFLKNPMSRNFGNWTQPFIVLFILENCAKIRLTGNPTKKYLIGG